MYKGQCGYLDQWVGAHREMFTDAAAAQLSACIPNFLILEGLRKWDGFSAEILETPFEWHNGKLILPQAPGLGVSLNEKAAEKHKLTPDTPNDKTHQTMADEPIE